MVLQRIPERPDHVHLSGQLSEPSQALPSLIVRAWLLRVRLEFRDFACRVAAGVPGDGCLQADDIRDPAQVGKPVEVTSQWPQRRYERLDDTALSRVAGVGKFDRLGIGRFAEAAYEP